MSLYEPQPAHLMYPFDGGWQVMRYVRANVFARTDATARTWFNRADDWTSKADQQDSKLLKYWFYCMVAGFWLAGASQYTTAMVLVATFMLIQFTILVLWAALVMLTVGVLMLFNYVYGSYHRIFFRCPTAGCYHQMTIPIYVCPTCATQHTRLWPSVYGIFRHRCSSCDTKLPTLNLLGRKDLSQVCVACGHPMTTEIGRLTNIHIPVIGGPSAGKSNFIFMATQQFINDYALPRQYQVEFPDDNHREQYERNVGLLSTGDALPKTPDIRPQAYNLAVWRSRRGVGKIIYLYDAAGEAYATEDATQMQGYFTYVHGLIFVIDPFSIDLYQREHEAEIDALRTSLRPSGLRAMSAYERMLSVLEASSEIDFRRGRRFQHPIAVVISKSDALDLPQKVGDSAAEELLHSDPSLHLREDATNLLVESFLLDYGLGNMVRDLYLQFRDVRFFSCTALGRMPDEDDHSPFTPSGVLEPLLWILGMLKVADVQKERVQHVDHEHWSRARSRGNILKSLKYYYHDSLRPRGNGSEHE